ncbi:hypothetical protein CJ030_MR5G017188 [Morella rubra]|uniref:RNase H type-1 domain-containing protein n=1 Tax=Morella rubra TaxID=262757 RepID=A0A6A1VMQ2_9ROSI|nr:hypothetical protein CJ030_MR5G017188 [Morella rubra]
MQRMDEDQLISWSPPEPGWMKINFDVAIRQEGSYIAVSCRDSSSSLCTAYMERIQAVDPFMGETMAAVRAVELALEKRWTHVLFESDSKLLCDDLASELPPCWKSGGDDFFPPTILQSPVCVGSSLDAAETQSTSSFTSSLGSSFEDFWF